MTALLNEQLTEHTDQFDCVNNRQFCVVKNCCIQHTIHIISNIQSNRCDNSNYKKIYFRVLSFVSNSSVLVLKMKSVFLIESAKRLY